ncbi:MAG: SatD family protein [Halanaerobiaceae bacterium]
MRGWIITADIVESRNIKERKTFQQQLQQLLDEINDRFSGSLGCRFHITLGDQFSGLVMDPETLLEIVLEIICGLNSNVSFRFGIAFGEVETGGSDISGGPGYRMALKGVKKARKKKLPLVFTGENLEISRDMLELILAGFIYFFNGFSCRQRQIMLRIMKGKTQSEIAGELGITQPAVSQALKNIYWRFFRRVYHIYPRILSRNKEQGFSGEYTALIGSWEGTFGESLQSLLREINNDYRGIIESRFVVTVPFTDGEGYEFQGLLHKREGLFDLISDLVAGGEGVKIGIGLGEIDTELRKEAVGMDGPAFYRAREAIDIAKDGGLVSVCAGDGEVLTRLSAALSLVLILPSEWTYRQWRIVKLKRQGWTQEKIGKNLGITRPTVSSHLAGAGWNIFSYFRKRVGEFSGMI